MVRPGTPGANPREPSPEPGPSESPAPAPSRKVSFGRGPRLRQGPSGSGNADTRHRSPSRPALQSRLDWRDGVSGGEAEGDYADGPPWEMQMSSDEEAMYVDDEEKRRLIIDFLEQARHDERRVGEFAYEAVRDLYELENDEGYDAVLEALREEHVAFEHHLRVAEMFAESATIDDNGKDHEVCASLSKILQDIVDFAEDFEEIDEADRAIFMEILLEAENEHLIRYIGCLALGGAGGERDWTRLVGEEDTRRALVVGIIGHALKEHVFADLWYGGRPEEKQALADAERSELWIKTLDGFERTAQRARMVQEFARHSDYETLQAACQRTTLQLEAMLAPFVDGVLKNFGQGKRTELLGIVKQAAELSRLMRQAPDVVYNWSPSFKDEMFDPSRMDCLNLADMLGTSPYERREVRGRERAALRDAAADRDRSDPIVKVVCFPGLVAYRTGGGRFAQEEEAARKKARPAPMFPESAFREDGIRSRVICKGVVHLVWGRQRLLTREAGTSAHVEAQRTGNTQLYDDDYDGFEELYDIASQRW